MAGALGLYPDEAYLFTDVSFVVGDFANFFFSDLELNFGCQTLGMVGYFLTLCQQNTFKKVLDKSPGCC